GLILSPMAGDWLNISHSGLGRIVAVSYFVIAVIFVLLTDRMRLHLSAGISVALILDVLAASLVLLSIHGGHSSIPMMLMVNVGVAALLLPFRQSVVLAALAGIG